MKGGGWIALHRQIMEDTIYPKGKPFSEFEAWIDLLLNVNHTDKTSLINGKEMNVVRGSMITSLRKQAIRWQWSVDKVRWFLKRLKDEQKINTTVYTTVYTHLTVCNYDRYQDQHHSLHHRSHQQLNNINKENNKTIYTSSVQNYQFNGQGAEEVALVRRLCSKIDSELPGLLEWEFPLTVDQLIGLMTKHGYKKTEGMLEAIENWKPAKGKNKSVFLTAKNWIRRDDRRTGRT